MLQCYLSDVIRQFADKGAEHEFQKEKDTENYIVDHHPYSGAGDDCSYIAVVFISGIERNFKMNRMKTVLMTAAMLVCVFACTAVAGKTVYAAPNDTIQTGISADGMDLSGMTQEQAQGVVQSYVNELGQAQGQLQAQDGQSVSISLSELGISWKNPELVSEAVSLGKKGNIVARYKAEKDLQNKGKNYPVVLDFDKEAIRQAVTERCSKFNVEAIDAHLTRVDGSFQIEDGQTGYVVDENASVAAIYDYLTGSWVKGENGNVALVMAVDEPKGKTEELAKVKELADKYNLSVMEMTGFLDGINDSLVEPNPIDTMEEDTKVSLAFDKEKLYKNMVDAKADWLYELPQWDNLLDEQTRKELYKKQKLSGTVVKGKKIGRNDPCPCGSGKKYKQCCGKNA